MVCLEESSLNILQRLHNVGGEMKEYYCKVNEAPNKDKTKEFNPGKDNPCWGCKYRAYSKYDWQNICLLDEDKPCIKEL